jgi:hypothetical protein
MFLSGVPLWLLSLTPFAAHGSCYRALWRSASAGCTADIYADCCCLHCLQRMDPVTVLSGDAPVLAVRLTQLAGGGSILAVTASHVVLGAWSPLLHGHSCCAVLLRQHVLQWLWLTMHANIGC